MTLNTVWLGLGSNIGNRLSYIEAAIAKLREILVDVQIAPTYNTDPVDYLYQPKFLNTVVRGETALTPQELLDEIQRIEHSIGRERTIEKGPRTIDIDILVYGSICETYEIDARNYLTVPHESMHTRLFALRPLLDLNPNLVDPRDGVSWSIKAEKLSDQQVEPYNKVSVNVDSDSASGWPRYRLDRFEGPLDLLLFLIRKNELSIYDIPVTEITEQYLAYLKNSSGTNLDEISEFYLMAATLLNIKSKMLLPMDIDLEDELDDPRGELVRSLIEYEKFRKLTDLISSREVQFDRITKRERAQVMLPFASEEEMWEEIDIGDLLKTFSRLMKSIGGEAEISIWEEVSINEKIALINEFLETKDEFDFHDICNGTGSLMEVISAFLAVLELTKMGVITVLQRGLFENVRIVASDK